MREDFLSHAPSGVADDGLLSSGYATKGLTHDGSRHDRQYDARRESVFVIDALVSHDYGVVCEEVLGPGTRKKAASAEAPAETPEVEHQTY